jgi:hypothetical protein
MGGIREFHSVSKFASFAQYPKLGLAGAEAVLLTAWASLSRYLEGPDVAIGAFHAEANASNRGYARAAAALRKHFLDTSQSGPVRCAAFALEGQAGTEDFQSRQRRIMEQMVTVGRALLESR